MALGILTERAGSERDTGPAAAQRARASSFARARYAAARGEEVAWETL